MNSKTIRKIIICLCLVLAIILAAFTVFKTNNTFGKTFGIENSKAVCDDYVQFLDVGQGDCALISSNGRNCLIDIGTKESASSVRQKLKAKGIGHLDLISISHFHVDHTGGLYDIVKKFSVDNLLYPPVFKDSNVPIDVALAMQNCISEGGDYYVAKAGQTVEFGDFKISVLYQNFNSEDENNRSIYIMANIRDKKFFFTGDGEKESENELLNQNLNIDCDVLKVPHHGGSNSTSETFLTKCSPEYAVISCGEGNSYGHPHEETLQRLFNHNVKTYMTDTDGDIIFEIDDKTISVSTDK